jgi:DNA mismatch endonuclease (patch repair protein)
MGFRYGLHAKDLPGRPDLVFRGLRRVIFVHGCFWHAHARCPRGKLPQSNAGFWLPKLERNVCRDAGAVRELRSMGWKVLVLWECQLHNAASLRRRIGRFLVK